MSSICRFCNLGQGENIIFETKNFIFLESKFPIIKGHCLLISKKHIRKESEFLESWLNEYQEINTKASHYVKEKYLLEPLTFINPPQQQSIPHFHKHFLPGVFGVLGVETALKDFYIKNQ